jgi:hypothetical protein
MGLSGESLNLLRLGTFVLVSLLFFTLGFLEKLPRTRSHSLSVAPVGDILVSARVEEA